MTYGDRIVPSRPAKKRSSDQFEVIFQRLRAILEKHAGKLRVAADEPSHYCLEVTNSPKLKKTYPAAWVKTVKSYVGDHFMPVYMFPQLREGLSKELKARMQGKSCFNFNAVDDELFRELEELTVRGFTMTKEAGV
jgi:hypothetical protein